MHTSSYFMGGKRKIDTITDLSYFISFFRVLNVTLKQTAKFPWQTSWDILKSKQKQPKSEGKGKLDKASKPCQMQLFSKCTQINEKEESTSLQTAEQYWKVSRAFLSAVLA